MWNMMIDKEIAYTFLGLLCLVPLYQLGMIIRMLYKIMFDK